MVLQEDHLAVKIITFKDMKNAGLIPGTGLISGGLFFSGGKLYLSDAVGTPQLVTSA